MAGAVIIVIGLTLAFCLYFLPWLVALMENHKNAVAIFVLNLLLGWTGLDWIGALVWACTK